MAKASTKKPAKAKQAKAAKRPARAVVNHPKASVARAAIKPVATKPPAAKSIPHKSTTKASFKAAPAPIPAPARTQSKIAGKAVNPLLSKKSNHAVPVILPSPVPTDGKPRKNQAGMHIRELEHFRELLLAKRRELLGDMSSMESEALRSATGSNLSNLPIHMADMGTDNYEQEFTLGLVEKDRQLLREINSALAKIQDGRYGLCEGTGRPITKPRLEAQPWAKYSIEHARSLERGMLRR